MDILDETLTVEHLLGDLRSELIEYKIACAKRLSTIALALGPQRLRSELLPALTGFENFSFEIHSLEINMCDQIILM